MNGFEVKVLQEYARRHGLVLAPVVVSVANAIDVIYILKLEPATEPYRKLKLWPADDANFTLVKGASFQLLEPPEKTDGAKGKE